jgi:hypothetical protein
MVLTLEERYYVNLFTRKLPCTLKLRFALDSFLNMIDFTEEEIKKYAIRIVPSQSKFECNDDKVTFEYKDVPEEVTESVREFVTSMDVEENDKNVFIKDMVKYLKKVL